jgi:hypothetical protein
VKSNKRTLVVVASLQRYAETLIRDHPAKIKPMTRRRLLPRQNEATTA